jgi:hypothetical protein
LWNENLVDGSFKFPQFTLLDNNEQYSAPFYWINMEDKYSTVSVTKGHNCLIQSIPLWAQPHPYPKPLLTQKEEFLFHDRESFTPLVNEAICMKGDITLRAEVMRYWRATAEVHSLASQIILLKRKFDDATWEVQNSGK